jgi:glycine/sarcosine N-methyltransferase
VGFYDGIAGRYDDIVGGAGRSGAAQQLASWLVASRGVRRVLDVACGTGLHARALAERGVQVVAADASGTMLEEAKARAGDAAGRIEWLYAPMETIARAAAGPFDAILCLGNSLPHLLTDAQLHAAIQGFRALLAPAGIAVVQLLNYDRILERRERIVGVTRRGDTEYVRFYDFLPENVHFNILELHWRGEECRHELHQTELRPYRAEPLCEAFVRAGFPRPELYSGPGFDDFDRSASEALLLGAPRER